MNDRAPVVVEPAAPASRLRLTLALVILTGVLARAQASLAPDLIVGDDGAYYLVQVRAILHRGTLAIPDFPLLFYLQAAVAWTLSLLMETPRAIVAAVRWTDTIIPVLLAYPVYRFVRAFSRSDPDSAVAVMAMVLAGLLAVASGNALETAGGTLKNAVFPPFALLFLFYLYRSLRDGDRRSPALAGLCFLVASLTHIGGLALCVTLLVLVAATAQLLPELRGASRRGLLVLLGCLVAALIVALVVDPVRAHRFLNPLQHPGWLFAGSPVSLWLRGIADPAVEKAVTSEEIWLGNALGIIGLYTLARHRAGLGPAERAVVGTATMTTLAFASPLLRPDVLERLAQIAFVPGLVPLSCLLCLEARSALIAAPIAFLALLNGALAVKTLRVTAFVRPAYEELVHMKAALPPGRVIVITRHGLEWWMVWAMETRFSNWATPVLARRDDYDAVLVLDEIAWGAFGSPHWSRVGSAPGTGIFDGTVLRGETFTTLAQGRYFRLSRVNAR